MQHEIFVARPDVCVSACEQGWLDRQTTVGTCLLVRVHIHVKRAATVTHVIHLCMYLNGDCLMSEVTPSEQMLVRPAGCFKGIFPHPSGVQEDILCFGDVKRQRILLQAGKVMLCKSSPCNAQQGCKEALEPFESLESSWQLRPASCNWQRAVKSTQGDHCC